MKYVLHYDKQLDSAFNRIFKTNNLNGPGYYIECRVLGQFTVKDIPTYKANDIVNFDIKSLKDVTDTYNKINRLRRKIALNNGNGNRWTKVNKISEKFENGKYPTKSEFKWMNEVWNKIK